MITYELVLTPLVYAIICFAIAASYFIWQKRILRKVKQPLRGQKNASLFGWSFLLLGSFCFLISLFFLIVG